MRARGDQCNGAPNMTIKVDGTQVLSTDVNSTSYTDYTATASLTASSHAIEISFPNDEFTSACDRNLIVDKVTFTTVNAPTPVPSTASKCDFNGDNLINSRDIAIFLGGYIKRETKYDLNSDGRVNAQDLAVLLGRCTR